MLHNPTQRRQTWPWILAAMVILVILGLAPTTQEVFLAWDIRLSYWLNGLLGTSESFDILVGGINAEAGDRMILILAGLFFAVHSFFSCKRDEVLHRLAFWIWALLLLVAVYQIQKFAEEAFSRDSPGKVLDGWIDLRKMYDVDPKVKNSRCFPSGHATAYLMVSWLVCWKWPRTGVALLIGSLVIMSTRVMTGAHWPSDIVLGSLPLTLLLAAVSSETRVSHLHKVIEAGLQVAWTARKNPKNQSLRDRFRGAWAELRARQSDGMSKGDPEE